MTEATTGDIHIIPPSFTADKLVLAGGDVVVSLATGEVTVKEGVDLSQAALEFWSAVSVNGPGPAYAVVRAGEPAPAEPGEEAHSDHPFDLTKEKGREAFINYIEAKDPWLLEYKVVAGEPLPSDTAPGGILWTDNKPRTRANYLPPSCLFGLHAACAEIMKAYPDTYGVYLVGSSIYRKDYRDVDIRCIVPDDVFDKMFPKDGPVGERPLWRLTCLALSTWISQVSGLPLVDFQFQKQTPANEKYGRDKGCERQALGYYHWRGDATD